jgi:F-type H+-transporting ATPase subunit epsilon
MHLIIAKVDEVYFDGDAKSITLPGTEGEMTVLSHHEPLITTLKAGTITVRAMTNGVDTDPLQFPITGGILEVRAEGTTVIL